jgi:hypothetical protein
MEQPPRFVSHVESWKVCRLCKSLYSLKQSPKAFRRIDEERKKKVMDSGPRQSSISRKKCLRELKSLPSAVNYEGKQLCF